MTTVLLDVRRATWRPHLGISRYARGLLEGIRELAPPDVEVVAVDLARSSGWHALRRVTVGSGTSFPRRLWQEQIGMVKASRDGDVLHLPWYEGPARARCPLVVNVHDLDTVERAAGYRWRFRAYYNSLLRLYLRTARCIVVPSQATLEELERRWPGRPYVKIPYGVDAVFRPDEEAARERLVLYTGGFGVRKRFADLLAAFDRVAERDRDVRLVVTGDVDSVRAEVRAARHAERVDLLGTVSEERLTELYRKAAVVAYPSEGEGFGFPVLEAFASGTPVVACALGSVPEVAGGAALLAPARRPDELADALLTVLDDPRVAARLREQGLARARDFSWTRTARETLDAYRSAAG